LLSISLSIVFKIFIILLLFLISGKIIYGFISFNLLDLKVVSLHSNVSIYESFLMLKLKPSLTLLLKLSLLIQSLIWLFDLSKLSTFCFFLL